MFVVAGNQALSGQWPSLRQDMSAGCRTLEDVARHRNIAEYFLFLGHIDNPEAILAGSDLLIKPTRGNNPWGRDMLEALAAGVPALSVGFDETFVETGKTGVLQPEFDDEALADEIIALSQDRRRLTSLAHEGKNRVLELCNPVKRAAELADVWGQVLARQ